MNKLMVSCKAFTALAIVVLLLVLNGCGLASKSIALANSSDAFMIAPDIQNGTVTYQLVAGGGANVVLLQLPYVDGKVYPTMMGYSRRRSMWGMFSGDVGASNVSFSFIGGNDLTPDEKIRLIEAVAKLVNDRSILKEQVK